MANFNFIQMADPQVGMFDRFSGMDPEAAALLREHGLNVKDTPKSEGLKLDRLNLTTAVEQIKKIDPAFVVVCGDMVDTAGDENEIALIRETLGAYGAETPVHWVPGNHDIGVNNLIPDSESTAKYRSEFGDDYYSFSHGESKFIILNSVVLDRPQNLLDEHQNQMDFLGDTLQSRESKDSEHVVAFMHHPLFLDNAEEADVDFDWAPSPPNQPSGYWTIPLERRTPVVKLLREAKVETVFAGHWHRNHQASDNGLDVVVTSALGYPLGDDPSGYRIVTVADGALNHEYREL
ncbi:MAG: metallophosphoesterase [Dehalococcoidia bacterium]|nr:metallophosphoesterase [Dehalococcoidia bacterium]